MATPERIRVCIRAGKEDWIGVAYAAETDNPSTVHEYVREDRKYFCSCGGALTAEEYITHYFELGHDRGDPAVTASAAPVVDGISWSALLAVLERLKSKTRNPDAEWYHGWNAAIQCLINDINARSAAAATAAPVEQSDER